MAANVADKRVAERLASAIHRPLFLLTARRGNEPYGKVVLTALSIFFSNPVKFVLALEKSDPMHEAVADGGAFALHALRPDQSDLARKLVDGTPLGASDVSRVDYRTGHTGCPVLDDCLGYIELEVLGRLDASSHTLFVGEVRDARSQVPIEQLGYGAGVYEPWLLQDVLAPDATA
jgi:flavin reductase (DIM6/NTAB) family NADH-FMN oxidoreductase RutF